MFFFSFFFVLISKSNRFLKYKKGTKFPVFLLQVNTTEKNDKMLTYGEERKKKQWIVTRRREKCYYNVNARRPCYREYSKCEREEGEKVWQRGKTAKKKKKLCMLAWLCVFLCGPFGGLLLIKLLLHDAPSWLDLSQGLCEAGTA